MGRCKRCGAEIQRRHDDWCAVCVAHPKERLYEAQGEAANGTPVPIQVSPRGMSGDPFKVTLLLRGEDRTGLAVAFLSPEEADDLGFALMIYARAAMEARDAA